MLNVNRLAGPRADCKRLNLDEEGRTLPFFLHIRWQEQIHKQNLHFSSLFHKHPSCQPVNQLPDGRQMSLGRMCQISIVIGWNSIGWNELSCHSIPCNAIDWSIVIGHPSVMRRMLKQGSRHELWRILITVLAFHQCNFLPTTCYGS